MATEKKTENTAKKKMVTIHLFRDGGRYSGDMIVGVGGKIYRIKRGVDVEVPETVAKVIEKSLKRDNAAAEMMYRKSKEAESAN